MLVQGAEGLVSVEALAWSLESFSDLGDLEAQIDSVFEALAPPDTHTLNFEDLRAALEHYSG